MDTPDDDNPYDLLSQDHDEGHRWAFGTGFADPLAGIDTSVPAQLDPDALARWCLALGDDALIYSHRLQQWVARLPELEEETAVANIALDLLGQARLLLSRAGGITGQTEDQLAFFREEKEFRSVRLAEHADRDFAEVVVRLLIFSTWRLALFEELSSAPDPVLAAIAAKGVNELAYHRDYAAQLGGPPRRRHPGVARQDPGRPRRPVAPGRRAVPPRPRRARDRRPRPPSTPSSTPCWPRPASTAPPPPRSPRSAAGPAATACTRRRWATSWPSSSPSPAPTRTRPGDPDDRADERVPGRGGHPRPGTPHADDRGPRHPPIGRPLTSSSNRHHHPHLQRLPGHARDHRRHPLPPHPGRLRPRHRQHPARTALVHRLDHRRRPPQARRRRHRPADPRPPPVRPRPADADRAPPRPPARAAAPPTPAARPSSAPPPASPCTAATPAASPSRGSRRYERHHQPRPRRPTHPRRRPRQSLPASARTPALPRGADRGPTSTR